MHVALCKLFLILKMTLQKSTLSSLFYREVTEKEKDWVGTICSTQAGAWKSHNLQVAGPGFSAKVKLVFLSLASTKILLGFFRHTLVYIALPLPHTKGIE